MRREEQAIGERGIRQRHTARVGCPSSRRRLTPGLPSHATLLYPPIVATRCHITPVGIRERSIQRCFGGAALAGLWQVVTSSATRMLLRRQANRMCCLGRRWWLSRGMLGGGSSGDGGGNWRRHGTVDNGTGGDAWRGRCQVAPTRNHAVWKRGWYITGSQCAGATVARRSASIE